MSTMDDAQKRLGELFIIGIEGKSLSDDTSAFLSQAGIGGVILFSHNYEEPSQVASLVNEIQDCRGDLPFWMAVDQEGGRVQRFKDPFTIIPPAATIGKSASPKNAFEVSQVQASELKAVGINLNFAPCADILTNPDNKVIGDRAFGTEEDLVTRMVTAMVRGHVTAGVQPCVKHFPGHGDTLIDSHDDLPKYNKSVDELREREFKPFVKTFKSRCNMVMVGHLLNEAIDSKYPATLSKKFLTDVLRGDLRYSRIIIDDDMEMEAVTKHYGAKEAVVLAIAAGADLLIYRTENAARHAYEAAFQALDSGKLKPEDVLDSAERLRALKKEILKDYQPASITDLSSKIGTDENKKLVKDLVPT